MKTYEVSLKYISFLKSVLKKKSLLPIQFEKQEWEGLYSFAQMQTIEGILFKGVQSYYDETKISIPSEVILPWIAQVEIIKQRNLLLNKRCVDTVSFFSNLGFRSCILKGQGNALMYPDPELRVSGDIDIWVEGDRKSIKEAVFNKVGKTFEVSHHIALPLYDDVDIEVHFTPSELCNPFNNKKLQEYYRIHQDAQMGNYSHLTDRTVPVSLPTNLFNAIFQLSHIMYHFFIEGVGLRHLIDYFYLLSKGFSDKEKNEYEQIVKKLGMLNFSRAVMWVEKEVLGLDEQYLLMSPYEKGGRLLFEEIIATGNMGHYDKRYIFRKHGLIARGLTDAYRDLRLSRVFPSEGLWKPFQKIINQQWKVRDYLK